MLTMDAVVSVDVDISSGSTLSSVYDVGALVTDVAGTGANALTTTTRFASYSSLPEMANGAGDTAVYASTTDVYKAAALYFGVSPAPKKIIVIYYDDSNGETPAAAILDAIDKGADFYGVYYVTKSGENAVYSTPKIEAVVQTLITLNRGMLFYGMTGVTSTSSLSSSILNNAALKQKRALCVVCAGATDDAPAVMGAAMGLSRTHNSYRGFALCYKPVASATVSKYTQSQIDQIKSYNGNVYVSRTRNRSGLENGATGDGKRFDEVLYVDRICNEIQAALYAMIVEEPDKLPQTDSTSQLFINEIYRILHGYYTANVLATQIWRGQTIGNIENGSIIENGYVAWAESFDTQTTADRAAHKAMPITILLCLSGSVESVEVHVHVRT